MRQYFTITSVYAGPTALSLEDEFGFISAQTVERKNDAQNSVSKANRTSLVRTSKLSESSTVYALGRIILHTLDNRSETAL